MAKSLQGDGKAIFTIFVGAIIVIVFLASIGSSIFTQTTTATNTNDTVTVLAINTSLALAGRDLISATTVSNGTAINLINLGLIIDEGLVNSVKTVRLTANDTGTALVGDEVNVTYTYEPDGYIQIAGGRSIANLITIISALAILIFVVVVLFQPGSSFAELVGRGNKGRRN